jgi:hypothetical protein|tara:strand:+ start:373 stop:570 length:198 start_codon:yes stop_codon:yes gene_type:complete
MFVTMTVRLNIFDKAHKKEKPECAALPFDRVAIEGLIHKGLRFRACDEVWVTVDKLDGKDYPKLA